MRNTATCVIYVGRTGIMVVRIYEHCTVQKLRNNAFKLYN